MMEEKKPKRGQDTTQTKRSAAFLERLAASKGKPVRVDTGQVRHLYNGECPDEVEGPDVRDPDCPACQVLLAAVATVN